MLSSNVEFIKLPMDCTAWRFLIMRQSHDCSTSAPRSSAAKKWVGRTRSNDEVTVMHVSKISLHKIVYFFVNPCISCILSNCLQLKYWTATLIDCTPDILHKTMSWYSQLKFRHIACRKRRLLISFELVILWLWEYIGTSLHNRVGKNNFLDIIHFVCCAENEFASWLIYRQNLQSEH